MGVRPEVDDASCVRRSNIKLESFCSLETKKLDGDYTGLW